MGLAGLLASETLARTIIPMIGIVVIQAVVGIGLVRQWNTRRLILLGLVTDVVALLVVLALMPATAQLPIAFLLLVPSVMAGWRFGRRMMLMLHLGGLLAGLAIVVLEAAGPIEWGVQLAPWLALMGGGLAVAFMLPGERRPLSLEAMEAEGAEGSAQQVFTRLSRVLAQEMNSQRVLQNLLDLGAEVIWPKRPGIIQGMALLVANGHTRQLKVEAILRVDSSEVGRRYEEEGVFHEVLSSGEGAITTPDQLPLDKISSLRGVEVVMLPLRTALDIYGLVIFASPQPLQLDQPENQRAELLLAMVNQCALALQNTLLQHEVRQGRNEVLLGDEESRHKLARDLHDGPIQRVAAIVMQLEFVKALLKRQPDRVQAELDQVQHTARQAAQEMRTMLFTLRPIVLESEGLVAAINQYVSRLREQERVNIKFESDEVPRFEPQAEEAIFAIVQEAAGNAKKYANGALITIRLMTEAGFLVAQVEDKGPGFDVKKTQAGYSQRASLGMINMEERARMVDGRLKIESAPGEGTTVSLAVPLPDKHKVSWN